MISLSFHFRDIFRLSQGLCQHCILPSSAFRLCSTLAVASSVSLTIYYAASGCLDVHSAGSKLHPEIPHGHRRATSTISNRLFHVMLQQHFPCCWLWYQLVFPTGWVHPCEATVLSHCQHQPWCGKVGGYNIWLVLNMYWQQASSRGSVWSGIYMDIYSAWGRLAGRQLGGVGGVEQREMEEGHWHPSGAVSRLADCMIRAGEVWEREWGQKFVYMANVKEFIEMWCSVYNNYCKMTKASEKNIPANIPLIHLRRIQQKLFLSYSFPLTWLDNCTISLSCVCVRCDFPSFVHMMAVSNVLLFIMGHKLSS